MSPKIPNPLGLERYQHPSLILQLSGLSTARDDLRQKNLFEHEDIRPAQDLPEAPEEAVRARMPDGTYNDLGCPHMGAKGTGFGRNVPIENLLTPDYMRRVLWAPPKVGDAELDEAVAAELLRLGARQWQVDLMAPLIAEAIRHPAEPEPEPAPEPAPVETDGQPEAS